MLDTVTCLLAESDNYISFPNIGIKFVNMSRYFSLWKFNIHWYGVIICAGLVLCILLGLRFSKKYALNQDSMLDYVIAAVPSAIVGARLYYVLFRLDYYLANPKEIIAVWNGGLAIYGGIIGALIAIFIMSKVKKDSFFHIMDFAMPYIMLGQAIGRWGNFINQEAYGSTTNSIFGMTGNIIANEMGNGVLVHPTFLYESVWCLLGFVFLVIYRKKLQKCVGEVSALYMIIYGAERAVVEGLRTDSLTVSLGSNTIRVSQWLSVILVVLGVALFIDFKRRGIRLQALLDAFDGERVADIKHLATADVSYGDDDLEPSDFENMAAMIEKISEEEDKRAERLLNGEAPEAVNSIENGIEAAENILNSEGLEENTEISGEEEPAEASENANISGTEEPAEVPEAENAAEETKATETEAAELCEEQKTAEN